MAKPNEFQLDPEELVLRFMDDPRPDLKDLIMVQYAPLVERTARRFSGLDTFEDLVQVGFIGLLNALSKFEPSTGVRFNTYATHLVAGEIKHFLRDRSQTIRQPAWLQELRHRVNRAASTLQGQLARVPTHQEIADHLGVSEDAVLEVFQTGEMLRVASLDSPIGGEDDGSSEMENLDAGEFCPEQLSVEDRVVLEAAMQQLRDLERQVLIHLHFDSMSQTEIAHKLGISCNYVSHILRQSLTKLRRILNNEEQQERLLKSQLFVEDDSVIDQDTGVYNEAYFRARLEEELHRATSEHGVLGLLRVDFTGLQTLRSFYGEASVRDFLADAGDFLRSNVRRLDITTRCGTTGFAIILPMTGPTVSVVRTRIEVKMKQWLVSRMAPTGPVKLKIGQACYPDDAISSAELLNAANPVTVESDTVGESLKAA